VQMKEFLNMKIFSLCKSEINLVFTGISCFLSIASLFVAYESAKSSNEIALQALATATQANEISLGRLREPSAFQFADGGTKEIDLRTTATLEQELRLYVALQNDGKKIIDGAVFEAIGIEGLTYVEDESNLVIRELPSVFHNATFNLAVQPAGVVHYDIRKLVLQYLQKLADKTPNKNLTYKTVINVVVTPKALGESIPVGAPSKLTPRDRVLFTVQFKPSVIETEMAKKILSDSFVPNRVFSPQ
jgi:hypothetical protein